MNMQYSKSKYQYKDQIFLKDLFRVLKIKSCLVLYARSMVLLFLRLSRQNKAQKQIERSKSKLQLYEHELIYHPHMLSYRGKAKVYLATKRI